MKAAEASSRVFEEKARVKTKITNTRYNVHHTCKKKNKTPGILKKNTLHDHPQPRTSEVAVNMGFCFTSRSTSTRSALTPGSRGFREPLEVVMVFWYIQELHVFLLITIPCPLVPLFPCQTTFDKRVKKMDASKSR